MDSPAGMIGDKESRHGTNPIVSRSGKGDKRMTSEQIQAEMNTIKWFHRIELGDGIESIAQVVAEKRLHNQNPEEIVANRMVFHAWK